MDSHLIYGIATGLAAVILLGLLAHTLRKNSSRPRSLLPPGLKPLPLIRNVLDIPHDKEWLIYNQWAQRYGAFMSSRR